MAAGNWLLGKGKLAPREGKIGSSGKENWLFGEENCLIGKGKLAEGKMGELTRELILLVWPSGRANKGELTRELILLV